jgi:hypothetical protein
MFGMILTYLLDFYHNFSPFHHHVDEMGSTKPSSHISSSPRLISPNSTQLLCAKSTTGQTCYSKSWFLSEYSQPDQSSCNGRREWVQPRPVGGGLQQRHFQCLKANQSPIRGFLLPGTASNPSEVFCMGVSQLANLVIHLMHTAVQDAIPQPIGGLILSTQS